MYEGSKLPSLGKHLKGHLTFEQNTSMKTEIKITGVNGLNDLRCIMAVNI